MVDISSNQRVLLLRYEMRIRVSRMINDQGQNYNAFSVQVRNSHDVLPLEINTFCRNIHLCKIKCHLYNKTEILISVYFRP